MLLGITFVELLRNEFARLGPFWWMVWNALLALLPVLLALVLFKREDQPRHGIRNATFGFEFGLVLLFLPNAPYVATDLVHFVETVRMSDTSLWKLLGTEFPLYVAFVLFGLACYSFTTDRLLYALEMRLGKRWYWIGLFAIPVLSAIGIYLGRVARFNSWDILDDPGGVITSIASVLGSMKVAVVVASMAVLLLIVHQFYKIVHDGLRVRLGMYPVSKPEAS